jgi:hypothetical protein
MRTFKLKLAAINRQKQTPGGLKRGLKGNKKNGNWKRETGIRMLNAINILDLGLQILDFYHRTLGF